MPRNTSVARLVAAAPALSRRARLRDDLERTVLGKAEKAFADEGYEGASLADIAEASGLSKQNLMYYFPTKLGLYERVLEDVLGDWLKSMSAMAHSDLSAEEALQAYIRAKLEFSRRRPAGSRVYALEVINGAKRYGRQIKRKVVPVLRDDIATLNKWLGRNRAAVSAEHLMFIIWAATQSYADFAAQMELILGKRSNSDEFFAQAEATLNYLVLGVLKRGAGSGTSG
jgi:TetR/AcrR family transcriptional regulator